MLAGRTAGFMTKKKLIWKFKKKLPDVKSGFNIKKTPS